MRFLFMLKWPVDTLDPDNVLSALVALNPHCKQVLQDARKFTWEGFTGLAFKTETLSDGSGVCIQAKRWFEDQKVPIILQVHEKGWHIDFDLLDFLVTNLGWTAGTMESIIRGLKQNRGKRPSKPARDARIELERFLARNGSS